MHVILTFDAADDADNNPVAAPGSLLQAELHYQARQALVVRHATSDCLRLAESGAAVADLDTEAVKGALAREASQRPGHYERITQLFDQLDEQESLLIQIRLMQSTEPEFVYKKTIQPYNQV